MTSFMRWVFSLLLLAGVAGCEVDYDTEPEPDTNIHVDERGIDVPDVEIEERPNVIVPDSPDVNVQEGPDVNVEEAPDVEVNEAPDLRIQETPDRDTEETPGAAPETEQEPQS